MARPRPRAGAPVHNIPNKAVARYNQAVILHGQGDVAGAVRGYEDATSMHPRFAEAWSNLGNAYRQLGRRDDALRAYDAAIRAKPDFAVVHCNRGALLIELERHGDAIGALQSAIRLAPALPEAHANLGQALRRDGQFEAAMEASRKAIALRPDYGDAYVNLAAAAFEVDALDEALRATQRAAELDPANAQSYFNTARVLHAMGRYEEAIAACDRAIALQPDHVEAHANRALSVLLTGDFARGWAEYPWIWRLPTKRASYPYLDRFPLWNGQPFPGRRLLITREQGFGDAILMARYMPLVKARGGTVELETQPALASLFAHLPGVDELRIVEDVTTPRGDVDLHIPIMGLPWALQTGLASIPARVPYLSPDPAKVERWSARLNRDARLRVGIAWAGNPHQVDDRHRSLSLPQFGAFGAIDGIAWFGLQKGRDESLRESGPLKLDPLGSEIADFSDTAAILSVLDLVITVDTSVAHLAGALGRPTWVLVPFVPHWSYLLDRADSLWYPTMRLFRQSRPGDWTATCSEIAAALRERIA